MTTATTRTVLLDGTQQLKAIANETRATILRMLDTGPASASMLAAALEMTPGKVGHHVTVLERAGLIEVVEKRQVRAVTEKLYAPTYDVLRLGPDTPGQDRLRFALRQAEMEAATPQPNELEDGVRLVTVRMSPDRAAEFATEVHELARQFMEAADEGATTTFGLAGAVFATNTPALTGDTPQ